jgi:hypothetical protein
VSREKQSAIAGDVPVVNNLRIKFAITWIRNVSPGKIVELTNMPRIENQTLQHLYEVNKEAMDTQRKRGERRLVLELHLSPT